MDLFRAIITLIKTLAAKGKTFWVMDANVNIVECIIDKKELINYLLNAAEAINIHMYTHSEFLDNLMLRIEFEDGTFLNLSLTKFVPLGIKEKDYECGLPYLRVDLAIKITNCKCKYHSPSKISDYIDQL